MACRFAAYESTFTCTACATSTDCCLLDRHCVQSVSYAFGAVAVVMDQIELVHSLPPNVDTIVFRGNGLRQFGLATDAAALTRARTTQLSIIDNPSLRESVLLPSSLQVLNMSQTALDRAVLTLPPTLSQLLLDDCELHSLLNVTFPTNAKLTYFSAKRNFLTRFERVPMAETIDLSSNRIKLVRLQSFQNASTLILDNNTDLATIFAAGSAPRPFLRLYEHFLYYCKDATLPLQCNGCNLTTVAVDDAAFLSLRDAALPPTASWRPCPTSMRASSVGHTHVCVGDLNTNAFVPACPFVDMVAGSALTTAHCTTFDALYCVVDRFCHEAEPFLRTRDILLDFHYVDDPMPTTKFQRRQLQVVTLPNVDTLTIRNALDVRFLGDANARLRSLCASRLEGLASWHLVDPKTSVLPQTLETFVCVACGWKVLPTSYAWPNALQHLTLQNTQLLSFPSQMRWPPRLASFDAANNQIELFTGLPTVTTMLNLSGNALHNALMRNFHGASILDLSHNAPLLSVVFLSGSSNPPTLRALHLEGCDSLVNITLDAASYAAVKDTVYIYAPSTAWHAEPCLGSKLLTVNSTRLGVCVIENDFAYGAFFGIVLGACLLLALAGAWMRMSHRRAVPETNDAFQAMTNTYDNDDDPVRVWKSTSLADLAATMTSGLLPYRLNTDVEILDTILGRGAYGEVVLGRYGGNLVAVKRLRADNYTVAHMEMLIQEIELMARFSSDYLVAFVGASWCTFADMKCVVEFMGQGDLQQYLSSTKDGNERLFPWSAKLQCMRRMLRGLVYLHGASVIHRDLKSRNVLLNDAGEAKLGDFGIAREVSEESMTNAVGTYRWTAPEVLKGKHYDEKADIYSFGMILTELDTHALPYADMVNERGQALGNFTIMYKVMQGTILPTLSPTCSPWLRDLVYECIAHDASMRPSAADLDARLTHVDLSSPF